MLFDKDMMMNFGPGEYMKKMIFQSMTQVTRKKNPSTPHGSRTHVLLVTTPDAPPLSHRRLVGAEATYRKSSIKPPRGRIYFKPI